MESKHKLFGKFCHREKWENSSNIQKARRLTLKNPPVLWGLHIKVENLFLQETHKVQFHKPTCVAGSPYQKEDSLYDDYDGDNAAG